MDECCRRVRAVDITPILAALPAVAFVPANSGSTNPKRAPCWVPAGALPGAFDTFVAGLDLPGKTRRLLLRRLAPRQGMAPHVDDWLGEADWRRYQVPLVSHPDIRMRWPDDGVDVHLEPGWLYEVRFDRLHEVVHGADVERIHLQIDQVGA